MKATLRATNEVPDTRRAGHVPAGRKSDFLSIARDNRVNLFGADLESGAMTQLTDWDPAKVTNRHSLSQNLVREEIAFYYDNAVQVLDLVTLTTCRLMDCPKGYTGNLADFTADGRYVVTGFCQDPSDRFQVDLLNGYIGFNETWAAKPHSTIWKNPCL